MSAPLDHLKQFGYALLRGVFDVAETDSFASRLSAALEADEPSVLRSRGQTYGSRDLIRLFPDVCNLPRQPILREFISATLGPHAGLVRALYFDKPPDRSWSLPWHKDRTIAVKDNNLPTTIFKRPTSKAGVPHVEAPQSLLTRMLTLRLHLDAMTAENGPLSVIPGSHIPEAEPVASPVAIHADAGDVLAMRPLLSHSSSLPRAGTTMHRRIIHLELAPSADLPDSFQWHWFNQVALTTCPQQLVLPIVESCRPPI
jgi:hypothetical protein